MRSPSAAAAIPRRVQVAAGGSFGPGELQGRRCAPLVSAMERSEPSFLGTVRIQTCALLVLIRRLPSSTRTCRRREEAKGSQRFSPAQPGSKRRPWMTRIDGWHRLLCETSEVNIGTPSAAGRGASTEDGGCGAHSDTARHLPPGTQRPDAIQQLLKYEPGKWNTFSDTYPPTSANL
ncbi:heat shock protein 70 family protein [Klebsormidium nitens]|uniref:Heat shock protein 70 family protein n=1 Tax=Klebsormidium nitens TaxID=105231 RepID=A0A1Y1IPH9_KLENI|nr:heat shock protein 70 family protein [Klebsormidium nitens]|eukprot:GAQ90028.1 heat shock protein 70 family protein [Klebsormidium nitens]